MTRPLSQDQLDALVATVRQRMASHDSPGAWSASERLREHQASDYRVALALVDLVDSRAFEIPHALEALRGAYGAHADDPRVVTAVACALEAAHDVNFLNGPPPSDPLFRSVATQLRDRLPEATGDLELAICCGLGPAARLLGPSWDADAERAYRRIAELRSGRWQDHYNLGLFYKVRARFREGMLANERASELGGADREEVLWNLGICATGAREGARALAVWRTLGQHVELGRFGLPEGGYPVTKVRLAQHPVAERGPNRDDPGLEESIWIERLSPCHGIVRVAMFQDLGVDYGDVILFDGAPVTYQKYGDTTIPVFPHLVTLQRSGYRVLRFVATQPEEGAVTALSRDLPHDTVLYAHTENFVILCTHCWSDASVDHAAHRKSQHHVVRGKLCAPSDIPAGALLAALDAAVARRKGISVYVPELSALAGDAARAEVEARRMAMVE